MDLVGRRLDFEAPDEDAFRCLPLAREAGRAGGTAPAVLNAANEVAVAGVPRRADRLPRHPRGWSRPRSRPCPARPADTLEAVLDADARARVAAEAAIDGGRLAVPA